MKKLFLLAVCLVATSANMFAGDFFSTEKPKEKVIFGYRGGPSFNNYKPSEGDKPGMRVGLYAGVNLEVPIVKSFHVQTGLMVAQKGCRESETYNKVKYIEAERPTYLEIPILASYRYYFSEKNSLQISTGPYLAVGVGGRVHSKIDGKHKEGDKLFGKDGYNRFDAGWHVAAGVNIKQFYIGYAFEAGLANMLKDSGDYSMKTRMHSIQLGLNF